MKEFLTYSDLCSRILACPRDFLSNPSLLKVSCFIGGYSFATKDSFPDAEFYLQFSWWVADRFAVKTSHNWQSIISFEAGSEATAIEMARSLWREYSQTSKNPPDGFLGNHPAEGERHALERASIVFEVLQERPALYVGYETVIGIKAFMDGYEFALRSTNLPDDALYAGFSPWVAKRFNKKVARKWDEIVSFIALSESAAFALTKRLWIEYKADHSLSEGQSLNEPA